MQSLTNKYYDLIAGYLMFGQKMVSIKEYISFPKLTVQH